MRHPQVLTPPDVPEFDAPDAEIQSFGDSGINIEVEFWMTFDPTGTEGSREVVLQAYREVRDHLSRRIHERCPVRPMPST